MLWLVFDYETKLTNYFLWLQDTDVVRSNVVTGWAVGNWVYMLTVSLQTDVFRQQIEQTNLICAYVLLKPTSPRKYVMYNT